MFRLLRICIDKLPLSANGTWRLHTSLTADVRAVTSGIRGYHRSSKIRAAQNASNSIALPDLLAKIPHPSTDLSTDAIMDALKSIRRASGQPVLSKLLEHKQFRDFCQRVEHSANQFIADEAVDVLCLMHTLGMAADASTCQRILRVIQVNIADLHVDRIVNVIDFLKRPRSTNTTLSAAIKAVAPIVLLKKLQEDHTDYGVATDVKILELINTNVSMQFELREKLYEYVMHGLLARKTDLTTHWAVKILYPLLRMHFAFLDSVNEPELFDNTLRMVIDVLSQDLSPLTTTQLEMIVKMYTGFCAYHRSVFSRQFFNDVENHVLELKPEFDTLLGYTYHFHKVGVRSERLFNVFIEKIQANPLLLSTAKHYIFPKIIDCFSNAGELTENWTEIFWPAIQRNPLYQGLDASIDWFSITRSLLVLKFYDPHLIATTMDPTYLNNVLGNDAKDITRFHFLEVFQNCTLNWNECGVGLPDLDSNFVQKAISINLEKRNCPFQSRLEQIIGVDKIVSSIRTDLGHFIQHIMKFSCETNSFNPVGEINRTEDNHLARLEDISFTENEQLIAVQVFDDKCFFPESSRLWGRFKLQRQALHDLKLVPVILNTKLLTKWNDQEIRDYILNEISNSNQQIRSNL